MVQYMTTNFINIFVELSSMCYLHMNKFFLCDKKNSFVLSNNMTFVFILENLAN